MVNLKSLHQKEWFFTSHFNIDRWGRNSPPQLKFYLWGVLFMNDLKVNKMLVFDMDGTIANFYQVPNWLEDLKNYNPRPYEVAEPLYNMVLLKNILLTFKLLGWKVAVTSWLSKESTKEFDKMVRTAKKEWLKNQDFPYDEIHLVKYGTNKSRCTKNKADYQILVDDNADVRARWSLGDTINAQENIIDKLQDLLLKELEENNMEVLFSQINS